MVRYKLTLSYEGTRYGGWQMQPNTRSIQGELLRACQAIFTGQKVVCYGAGRTDAGVHAFRQVAHLEAGHSSLTPEQLRYRINDGLPHDICVLSIDKAAPDFHARHSAVARSYVYQISRQRTAFGKNHVWWVRDRLQVAAMRKAAQYLVGQHDFLSFTDERGEQSSTQVDLIHLAIHEKGDTLAIHIIGSRFLWKMVRRVVGVLVEVGRGNFPPEVMLDLLQKPSKMAAQYTAPPSGLFLERVYYPQDRIETKTCMGLGEMTFGDAPLNR